MTVYCVVWEARSGPQVSRVNEAEWKGSLPALRRRHIDLDGITFHVAYQGWLDSQVESLLQDFVTLSPMFGKSEVGI